MTVQKLQAKVRRHNTLQFCLGTTLALVAPVLWYWSFWIGRWLFFLPAWEFGYRGAWDTSLYVAWGFIAVLAWDGLRNTAPLFDLSEYVNSDFNWYDRSDTSSVVAYARYRGDPMVGAWLLLQFLFLAPRTTALAIESLKKITRPSPAAIDQATSVFNTLKADHHWHPASDFADSGPALRLLVRLRLIWVQNGADGLEIRFPAAMTEAELV